MSTEAVDEEEAVACVVSAAVCERGYSRSVSQSVCCEADARR